MQENYRLHGQTYIAHLSNIGISLTPIARQASAVKSLEDIAKYKKVGRASNSYYRKVC
jgi:hypothetical protein